MLKRFFMNMLSSFVGAWLAFVLLIIAGLILLMATIGNIASQKSVEEVKSRSILKISLSGEIAEIESNNVPDYIQLLQGKFNNPQALNLLIESLREAARNKNIAGVYLECGQVMASPATLNALRQEILEFRKSEKPVYAYGDNFSQGSYFVASAADRIYLNPEGMFDMQGLSSSVMYMKGLLDKLGIQMQVIKVGTYKSAVEPYILDHMSEPARAQLDTLLGDMWHYIMANISKQRKGLDSSKIDSLVSTKYISFAPAEFVCKSGLVDSLAYGRTMKNKFAVLTGQDAEKINFISPSTLVSQIPWTDAYSSKNQIAVLYATGEISDGNPKAIDYNTLVPIITKLADDEKVRGLVLRVNSPGGSAFGSAQIGEALDYFQSKGKPLSVSMGDYAASGGYWISAGADIIYADALTVTGSIGIFGLIPSFKGLTDKLGVNFETVSTNPAANFPQAIEPLTETQHAVMQKYVERGYETFVNRVAKGRKMTPEAVKRIAEGRVWNALTAQRIGLVDSIGSLQKAIEWIAKKLNIENKYDITLYPQPEPSFWSYIASSSAVGEIKSYLSKQDAEEMLLEYGRTIIARDKVQALMPQLIISFN